MNLKTRMRKLERERGGTEAEVTVFETLYEDEDGLVREDESTAMAIVVWGPGRSITLRRSGSESLAGFGVRVNSLSQLTWEQVNEIGQTEVGSL